MLDNFPFCIERAGRDSEDLTVGNGLRSARIVYAGQARVPGDSSAKLKEQREETTTRTEEERHLLSLFVRPLVGNVR